MLEMDVIWHGYGSVVTEETLKRPVFKVRMPDGRTVIETLEPDKI
jgi:hypothetical protein